MNAIIQCGEHNKSILIANFPETSPRKTTFESSMAWYVYLYSPFNCNCIYIVDLIICSRLNVLHFSRSSNTKSICSCGDKKKLTISSQFLFKNTSVIGFHEKFCSAACKCSVLVDEICNFTSVDDAIHHFRSKAIQFPNLQVVLLERNFFVFMKSGCDSTHPICDINTFDRGHYYIQ